MREERSWPIGLTVAVSILVVVTLVLVAVVAIDPRFLVELVPFVPEAGVTSGRAMQVFGALLLIVPVAAVVIASRQGARRAVGWLVVLAVLAALPATAAMKYGAARVRHATPAAPSDIGACVERSGGGTKCPGG